MRHDGRGDPLIDEKGKRHLMTQPSRVLHVSAAGGRKPLRHSTHTDIRKTFERLGGRLTLASVVAHDGALWRADPARLRAAPLAFADLGRFFADMDRMASVAGDQRPRRSGCCRRGGGRRPAWTPSNERRL